MDRQFMVECKHCGANIEDQWDHLAFMGFCSKACMTSFRRKEHDSVQGGQQPMMEKEA